ncbi:MAG: endonuclease/exonuclease/phosphatase family protein [Planctomycetota bacterium]
MTACWLFLALWLPLHGSEIEAPSAETVRIASFNLLNLFDNVDDPDRDDEGTDPKALEERQVLARTIASLEADVLGVQEVENREVLESLNRHLDKPFPYVELIEGNDGRGIDCGLLSRFPIESATSHRLQTLEGGGRFSRDFPVFRLRLARDEYLHVGVVHLKSKRGEAKVSDGKRKGEAAAAVAIIERLRALDPKTPCVVLGDFNDTRGSDPLSPFFRALEDPTAKIEEKQRYSYVYRGTPEQIDFILTTKDIKATGAGALHEDNSGSDHAPVWIDWAVGRTVQRTPAPPQQGWPKIRREAIDARDLEGLEKHLLQEVAVTGRVTKVHRPGDYAAILNFHPEYKKAVTVYIPAEAFPRLPDLDSLVGKTVTARGPVSRRGPLGTGVYSIRVTQSAQLTAER